MRPSWMRSQPNQRIQRRGEEQPLTNLEDIKYLNVTYSYVFHTESNAPVYHVCNIIILQQSNSSLYFWSL